jgi:DNA-binding IclR family transcriptional regulator
MIEGLIPEDIKQFILTSIDSIAQLEALLLLRANPQERWSVAAVAKRLYITEPETLSLLANLCEQGLVISRETEPSEYVYQPRSAYLTQVVERVAELYANHLVPVTNLIHSKPRTRIQEFADAFKLRKDE